MNLVLLLPFRLQHQLKLHTKLFNMSSCPKVFTFDLDGCVWEPEMYELWGGGGAPFKTTNDGETLVDKGGNIVHLLGDTRLIMKELKQNPLYKDAQINVASRCDEPSWARECIKKFKIEDGLYLSDVFQNMEIYKGNKTTHLKAIAKHCNVDLKEIIFFDNEVQHCYDVSKIGVTAVHTPNGLTKKLFDEGLSKYPLTSGEIVNDPKKRKK
ncbi:magnesium-dependent phosphatase 1 [Lepeophtheirus salmonis]|uniref:magnesium-dependent phosphatase 1 n=1 Tax=Lepeophtheirus salmonis TaxID=72036 RepID=UPI001AE1D947|nr:magnesium-dependent phosphatase 1-like [Lepeophtheirus salmonis]